MRPGDATTAVETIAQHLTRAPSVFGSDVEMGHEAEASRGPFGDEHAFFAGRRGDLVW